MQFGRFLRCQAAALGERGEKRGQGPAKGVFHKAAALYGFKLLLGDQRGHRSFLILKQAFFAQSFDDGMGGRSFPLKCLLRQFYQL